MNAGEGVAAAYRDQTCDRRSVAGDDDLLARFRALDKLRELGLGFVHPDLRHEGQDTAG